MTQLSNSELISLTEFRRELHMHPEISGQEAQTAAIIVRELRQLGADQVLTGLGGHGVAGVFDSGVPGETVLFRAELDALPIQDMSDAPWASQVPGKGHLCGHDGHMVMLLGLLRLLGKRPIARGRVVAMFQPAEEDGSGARAVVADPQFAAIAPDWAFAIHNDPGRRFGTVGTRAGLMNCASQGLSIHLTGKTAHAASPEDGVSPAHAMAALIPALSALGDGGALDADFRLATITHACLGEAAFGIAPADAVIHVTLRATDDAALEEMERAARALAEQGAEDAGLDVSFDTCDAFAASVNDPQAAQIAQNAMDRLGIAHDSTGLPMRASEDFGVFGWGAKAAMLCLGPGVDHPALHNPDYDFPDDLIPVGAGLFFAIAHELLGKGA